MEKKGFPWKKITCLSAAGLTLCAAVYTGILPLEKAQQLAISILAIFGL